jgi:hypothetical protein
LTKREDGREITSNVQEWGWNVHRAFGLSGIIQKFNAQGIVEASRHFGAPKPRSLKNQSFNSGARKKGREDNKLPRGNGVTSL